LGTILGSLVFQAGYLAAAFGGLLGAAAFIALGRFLGIAYAQQFMPNAEH
jgi:hypothetical protein